MRQLRRLLGMESNLLAHHLDVLDLAEVGSIPPLVELRDRIRMLVGASETTS